jgi:hypothetical protein
MLQIGKTTSIVAALILSTALITTSTSGLQFANAQTTVGQNMLGGLTSLRDQIVKGGKPCDRSDYKRRHWLQYLENLSS